MEKPPPMKSNQRAHVAIASNKDLDALDKDGDGNVDAEELDAVFGDAAAGFMKIFDSDGDGQLSRDELRVRSRSAWEMQWPQRQ